MPSSRREYGMLAELCPLNYAQLYSWGYLYFPSQPLWSTSTLPSCKRLHKESSPSDSHKGELPRGAWAFPMHKTSVGTFPTTSQPCFQACYLREFASGLRLKPCSRRPAAKRQHQALSGRRALRLLVLCLSNNNSMGTRIQKRSAGPRGEEGFGKAALSGIARAHLSAVLHRRILLRFRFSLSTGRSDRPLQGHSPYIVRAIYEKPASGRFGVVR